MEPLDDNVHYPQQCWYVAANVEDVPSGRPYACRIAGQDIVLYRTASGEIVAMRDRCPHRLAPLSLGRVEGDDLRCMYHGLRFAPDGTCTQIPGQDVIPKAICTTTIPVVESVEWVWIWVGDRDRVDEQLRPAELGHDRAGGRLLKKGVLEFDANAELINDNLCDLSHVAFTHENTLGALSGRENFAEVPPVVTYLERGIRFDRWHTNIPPAPFLTNATTELTDMWISYDYVLPGILRMETGVFPAGTAVRFGHGRPEGEVPFTSSLSSQAVTPVDQHRARYFYSVSVPMSEPDHAAAIELGFMMAELAFNEDKAMIEAQQRAVRAHPNDPMLGISHDKPLNHFRRMVRDAASDM